MRFWKCEFCVKWDFEIVNFVKIILSKCDFLDKLRTFAPVCVTWIARRSGGFCKPNNSWILISIWDLKVNEQGKAQEHNFPPRSLRHMAQNEFKKLANSASISIWVVVHPGIWQTMGDSKDSDIFLVQNCFCFSGFWVLLFWRLPI